MLLYAIIFISGGAILALELLASRILTPYFGVSLHIWTGILSITLVSLALGYWLGGRLASGRRKGASGMPRLLQLYALMPAIASVAIVAACLVYPLAFGGLARASLVAGAFAASLVLLFVPLVAASAMNPLLVAILIEREKSGRTGDAGAGKVFFVSTIGSVAGVVVTAFAVIPYVSNFGAVLGVALVLALLTLALLSLVREPVAGRGGVGAAALAAGIAAVALLIGADAYTGRLGPFAYAGSQWRVEASYRSLFGTVKVLRSAPEAQSERFERMYFQDGLTQNTVDSAQRSTSFYTYALEGLARAYRPQPRSALVLGLGAGMVPMALARSGAAVEVVDIDPVAARVARDYFGLEPGRVRMHEADARTFVRNCRGGYDVVVVDLFHGDGTPDYLVTREFFRDLRRCLAGRGIAVFNTFADLQRPRAYAHLLATLASELPHLALYRPEGHGELVNSFVVAAAEPLPQTSRVILEHVPQRHERTLWNMLSAPLPLTPALFAGGRIVTDAVNPAANDFAQMQMVYRRSVAEGAPRGLLVN
jgi:spermidine synthase